MSYFDIWRDPILKAMFDAVVDDIAMQRYPVDLNPLINAAFEPKSVEQQRDEAILCGEIKPGEPYLKVLSEEEQRRRFGLILWKAVTKAVERQERATNVRAPQKTNPRRTCAAQHSPTKRDAG